MYAEAEALFDRLGVHIDPRRPALGLSIADQQIIEIAKAISLDARVLIMDEPTAALSGVEVERLFAVARSLRDEGRGAGLHLAPLRRGLRALRHGHGDARRRLHRHRADRRHHRRRDRLADGRPRGRRRCSPRRPPTIGEPVLEVERPELAPASSTTSASRSAPARSSASPDWSGPAAARSPARSSASTATTRARSLSAAGACRAATRPSRDPRGHGASSPRTAASRAW